MKRTPIIAVAIAALALGAVNFASAQTAGPANPPAMNLAHQKGQKKPSAPKKSEAQKRHEAAERALKDIKANEKQTEAVLKAEDVRSKALADLKGKKDKEAKAARKRVEADYKKAVEEALGKKMAEDYAKALKEELSKKGKKGL